MELWFFMQEKKKTLDGYISLMSCYSNQSLDFQVPRLWQSSFLLFFGSLIGNGESETAAHRKRKGIIEQSLDADVPIPKRLYIVLRILSSTE